MQISGFGNSQEQREFLKRNSLFFDKYSNLSNLIGLTFIREFYCDNSADRAIFYLGRLCVEDFMEILLLCSNGYGIGGQKLIRGMYEKAVTARYLHIDPDQADDFFEYYWITSRKLTNQIKRTFGNDIIEKDKITEIETHYQSIKDRFQIDICKKCGKKRDNHSWNKLDFVSLSKKAGGIGNLIVPAYYLPTLEVHCTSHAIFNRLEMKHNKWAFKDNLQTDEADRTLFLANQILLDIIDLQKDHFNLKELEQPLEKCSNDFIKIWSNN